MAYLAKDLSHEQRLALESLLGRSISEREEITIRAYEPPPSVSDERRAEILRGLEAQFAAIDAKATAHSNAEIDDLFEEAMRSARPGYRTKR